MNKFKTEQINYDNQEPDDYEGNAFCLNCTDGHCEYCDHQYENEMEDK